MQGIIDMMFEDDLEKKDKFKKYFPKYYDKREIIVSEVCTGELSH